MKKIFILIAVLTIFGFSPSCTPSSGEDAHSVGESSQMESHGHEEGANMVTLTPDQMKSIDLQLGKMEFRSLTSVIKANGFLKVPNQNKATVTSLWSGIVKNIHVMPGSSVSGGQTIATIVNPQFIAMEEEYLGLAPKIELAEMEYKRQQELTAGNAGALKNLQSAEAELKTLRIRRTSLGQQLRLMGISPTDLSAENLVSQVAVKTPISGSVGKIMVNIGANVDTSTPIAEVVDNSQLHLDFFVYEKDLPYLGKGQPVQFILTNQPGKSYSAEVFSIGTTFENESRSIAVHCFVKGDKGGLIEGMSITAQVSVKNARLPALPDEAFVNYEGVDYVFIQKEGDKDAFEKIPVKKGTDELGYTEATLLAEAPENTQFVTKGAFFLLAKMTNAGEAHGH